MLTSRSIVTGLFVALFCVLAGCNQQSVSSHTYSGKTMGTTWSVKTVGECVVTQDQLEQRLIDVNQVASTYIADSELSVLNRNAAAGQTISISSALSAIIEESLYVFDVSDGAFDVTVGRLVRLWGFGPDFRSKPPSKEDTDAALLNVGSAAINVQPTAITYTSAREIDLSAIAKGWGVDQLGELLESHGCVNYLAEIGGELLAKGTNDRGEFWAIAVEKPQRQGQQAIQILQLDNKAVATSGDYRNFYEYEGKRYSHTIDPSTGMPVTHSLASVTVVANDATSADGFATALNVMGVERGMPVAKAEGLAVMFIEYEGDDLKVTTNAAFKALMR